MYGISDKNVLKNFSEQFCTVVEKHCKYIIVSGYVAIASGRSRATEDIDMIIERIPKEKFRAMHNDLSTEGFICTQDDNPEELFEYLINNTSIRYTRKERSLPNMEVKFAKDFLDNHQLQTRIKLPLTGLDLWFSSIEMNIAFKEEYLKSEKDLEDARHLRKVYKEQIDESKVNGIKGLIRQWRLN